MGNPTLRERSMERVGYHTAAKLHAVWKTRTMSILSRRGAPENACSLARRWCPPAPLLLLSLSPSSSFISVRKTLSRCLPTMQQPPAPPPILGIRIKKINRRLRGGPAIVLRRSRMTLLFFYFFFFYSPSASPTFRNTFWYPEGMKILKKDMQ